MYSYSSVRNKFVFSYNTLGDFTRENLCFPYVEDSLIYIRKICIAQVHKLKLCTC